jgi:bisanhydrobacterioruberin hydratase
LVWIILGILLFFISYFTVTFISPELSIISFIFVILFAIPSFYYLYKDSKKATYLLISLSIFAYTIETIGILTGFPYSNFYYTDLIGPKIGVTPLSLPFAFIPLVIGAMYFGLKQTKTWKKILTATTILVLSDLVLDPGAVAINLWIFEINGLYYGVPFVNFLGWILAGIIASTIFLKFEKKQLSKNILISFYLTITFWTGVAFWLKLTIPLIIGIIMSIILIKELKK